MIAEALKFLTDLAAKAQAPQKLDIPDPRFASYLIGGTPERIGIPAAPRDHQPKSLDEIVELANRFSGDRGPVVWYDETKVVLVIDDDGHRVEKATLSLVPSDVFARVVALRLKPERHEQKPFIRLIRIDLAGTLNPIDLLNHVRRIKFENGVARTGEVLRGKESVSMDILSKVNTETAIPEEVTLQVPVYKTIGLKDRYGLRCAVEVDPADGMFQLLPLPDEIERVQHLAVDSIAARLKSGLVETVPSYFGKA